MEGAAFATGSFVYIALCGFLEEIKEGSRVCDAIMHIVFMIMGLAFMYAFALVE